MPETQQATGRAPSQVEQADSTAGKDQPPLKVTSPHWGKMSELTKADVRLVSGSASCRSVET